uniref:Uncharacterized protein n=1 Tax=Caenorhabditis japonica TaxID=281687 RepID=A0A8R1HIL0_CAEJA
MGHHMKKKEKHEEGFLLPEAAHMIAGPQRAAMQVRSTEVCWEWIDAIERTPRAVDTRAISSSQLSIYYAYHTICRVQERMPRKATHSQTRMETWARITQSFSYLWAAATQLWKAYELDRLDILCSWSYLCFQFADVVTDEVLGVIEASKDSTKEVLSSVIVVENSHQANQRLLTVERNIRDTKTIVEKLGRRINATVPIIPTDVPSSPPTAKKWCGADGRDRTS